MDTISDKYFNKISISISNEDSSETVPIARYILGPAIFDILRGAPPNAVVAVKLADAIDI